MKKRLILIISIISFSYSINSLATSIKRSSKSTCQQSVLNKNCKNDFSCKLYQIQKTKACDTQALNNQDDQNFAKCFAAAEEFCLSKDNIKNFKDGGGVNKKIRITHSLCLALGEVQCKDNFHIFKPTSFKENIKSFLNKQNKVSK